MRRLFMGIILLFSISAFAENISLLKGTQTFKKGSAFVAELNFNAPIEVNKTSIEYINQTVQLNIRGASIKDGKQIKKIEDEKLSSIFTYQIEPDLMRTRLIYKKPQKAKNLEGYVHLSSKGNKLIVTIEDPAAFASKDVKKQFPVIPPVDLNAELEPKSTAIEEGSDLEASAAALLEKEFLSGINKKPKLKANKIEITKNKKKSILSSGSVKAVSPKPDTQEPKESEIPLTLGKVKEKKSEFNPWKRMIISLIVLCVFGVAMVFFAKRYSKSKTKAGGKIKIQVVSQQSIGPKKNLTVVRVAGEDILIGVTDYNISMIKSLSFIDDEIESDVPQDFVNELNKVTDRYMDSRVDKRAPIQAHHSKEVGEDDFSMGNIKDMISSKLKEMRPL